MSSLTPPPARHSLPSNSQETLPFRWRSPCTVAPARSARRRRRSPPDSSGVAGATPASAAVVSLQSVVPAPVSVQPAAGVTYTLPPDAGIYTQPARAAADVGTYLAGILRRSTGYALPVTTATRHPDQRHLAAAHRRRPERRRRGLPARRDRRRVVDPGADGRRALQRRADAAAAAAGRRSRAPTVQPGPWVVPGGRIVDYPRFALPRRDARRGPALPPGRDASSGYIDRDRPVQDQLPAPAPLRRPGLADRHRLLAAAGHRTAAAPRSAAAPGGYYTKAQYQEIVAYAAQRGTSRSSRRSTCRGTPTPRSPRTPS